MHYLNYKAGFAELVCHNIIVRQDLMGLNDSTICCHHILMDSMAHIMGTDGWAWTWNLERLLWTSPGGVLSSINMDQHLLDWVLPGKISGVNLKDMLWEDRLWLCISHNLSLKESKYPTIRRLHPPFQPVLGQIILDNHFQHEMTTHSPVIFLFEVAHRDEAGTAAHSELVLFGRPLNTAGGAVDSQDDQGGLPCVPFQGPHIGITVSAAGHNAVALRGPVNPWEKCRAIRYRLWMHLIRPTVITTVCTGLSWL